jgi:GDP-4-dehydro-6-deoxy-D-mannose reductase
MRVLVTGGNGFVGRAVVAALAARGDEPIVAGLAVDDPACIPLDLADALSVRGVVEFARADAVVHLAAIAFVPAAQSDPLAAYDVNAMGTARVLEAVRAVRAAGGPNAPVVVASTAEVYGIPEALPVTETAPLRPVNVYAASKVAAEAFAFGAVRAFGMDVRVARSFNAIGAGQHPSFAIASFAHQLAAIAAGGNPELRVGNLAAKRDFTDVRDIAQGYLAILDAGAAGEAYNLCSGRAVAVEEVLRRLVTIARIGVEIREDPARMRPSDIPVSVGSAMKLRDRSGWSPEVDLGRSLRDLYDAARAAITTAAALPASAPSEGLRPR